MRIIAALITASLIATPVLAQPPHGGNRPNPGRPGGGDRPVPLPGPVPGNGHRPGPGMGHGPGPGAGHRPGPSRPPVWHGWKKGDRFDRRRAQRYRILSRPSAYHLRPPPRGYHWVQSGNDAVLVAIATGVVASVIANAVR